jgi:hypothetical protein
MDATTEQERAAILRTIRAWPDDERLSLVEDILRVIRSDRVQTRRSSTLAQARGLLKADRPPPTDTEVAQWLDEYRMGRYGA